MQDPGLISNKHLRDIAGIIEQQELDHTYLDQAIHQLGLEPQWQAVKERGLQSTRFRLSTPLASPTPFE